MSTGDRLGAINAAYTALDHIARLRAQQEAQLRNVQAIAQLLAPEAPASFLQKLQSLHTAGIPPDKATRYIWGLEAMGARLRAFTEEFAASREEAALQRPAFLGTKAASAVTQLRDGSATEPARRPLPEAVRLEP